MLHFPGSASGETGNTVNHTHGAIIVQKTTIALTGVIAGLLIAFLASALASSADETYAGERALIEDLQARYLFALDFKDHDLYVTTFTEDGILDVGNGEIVGRDAIKAAVANMPGGRHHIANVVLRIDGDRATGRSSWFHTGNENPEGQMTIGGFGHYADDLVKVDGEWLFAKRRIYNEGNQAWAAPPGNPAW
jgi:hypothetical protein